MKMMKDTAPTEAVGRTIDGGQEAIMEILAKGGPEGPLLSLAPVSLARAQRHSGDGWVWF
jgi:hypothetical protein